MSGQRNTIYLADDKDENKVILVAAWVYPIEVDEDLEDNGFYMYDGVKQGPYYNLIEVGHLIDKVREQEWTMTYSMREFVDFIHWCSDLKESRISLEQLCGEIVADIFRSVTIYLEHASYDEEPFGEDYLYGKLNIDPVLAQAIIDSYN